MRRSLRIVACLALAASACVHRLPETSVSGAVLGRVVIYRNGVAFYERRATVVGGKLTLHVPRNAVDDFLKSLTVVDPVTRKPLSVSIPREEQGGDTLTMTLETADAQRADVLLTYVTEAPVWKPSYRVVVGPSGKVMLEGWAIVDNMSGEDWKGVLVGVGASSALSFRYDLWSVQRVDRELLQNEDKLALAPPEGVSPYAEGGEDLGLVSGQDGSGYGVSFSGSTSVENTYVVDSGSTKTGLTIDSEYLKNIPVPARTFGEVIGAAAGAQSDSSKPASPPPEDKLAPIVARLAGSHDDVVIQAHGATVANAQASAEPIRNKLIDAGIAAKRIHVAASAGGNGVHVLAVPPAKVAEVLAPPRGTAGDAAGATEPVGETHFIAERPMDVKAGTSAMVAMVHAETPGGVVYLYDPVSRRGDARFAFKAVELDNPTADTLEPGPITVYGDGRFVGEGITEAVPPRASVVVPFAADRQVMVAQHGEASERIARLETVQRGVITAELQRRRVTHFAVASRLDLPAKVFLRHKVEDGWTITDAPPRSLRVGDSQLYEVDVQPHQTLDVAIAETAPLERSLQLSSDSALDLMKLYLDEPDATPALKQELGALLATHRTAADLVDKIATLRDQLAEYKDRSNELHGQLVTLKAVRTSGDLMTGLRAKLLETSDKVQKLTLAIVDAEEQLMLTKVKFQNQLADLHLNDAAVAARR